MTFVFSRRLFLRLLGIVYLIAFASLGVQMTGLVGSRGILPVGEFLAQARTALGAHAYRVLPTLLWLSSSDAALMFLCWAGAALSIVLIAGIAPVATSVLLWVFYLSLTVAGQVFLEFQWDMLLLETGLLACLYAPLRSPSAEPTPIVRWVLWSLAFKVTFHSCGKSSSRQERGRRSRARGQDARGAAHPRRRPSVVRLLGPSQLEGRPRSVRLGYYDYRFTTRAERSQSGAWWARTFRGYLN